MLDQRGVTVYATSDNGDGYTEQVAHYDTLEEFFDEDIRVGIFSKDVVISFSYNPQNED